ncbi:hypothetical protein GF376_04930 [Candidatus Peregrinibacteria bacterium]|nr:hypothetical protein [Candidatus Peregrinibacteria bacterium]
MNKNFEKEKIYWKNKVDWKSVPEHVQKLILAEAELYITDLFDSANNCSFELLKKQHIEALIELFESRKLVAIPSIQNKVRDYVLVLVETEEKEKSQNYQDYLVKLKNSYQQTDYLEMYNLLIEIGCLVTNPELLFLKGDYSFNEKTIQRFLMKAKTSAEIVKISISMEVQFKLTLTISASENGFISYEIDKESDEMAQKNWKQLFQ